MGKLGTFDTVVYLAFYNSWYDLLNFTSRKLTPRADLLSSVLNIDPQAINILLLGDDWQQHIDLKGTILFRNQKRERFYFQVTGQRVFTTQAKANVIRFWEILCRSRFWGNIKGQAM